MKTAPGPDFIDKLFEIFNVNPDWIYKGKGNQYKTDKNDTDPRPIKDIPAGPVDINILQPVIQAVEDHLKNLSLVLAPKKKAELIILLYEHFAAAEAEVDQETVIKYLRLAAYHEQIFQSSNSVVHIILCGLT